MDSRACAKRDVNIRTDTSGTWHGAGYLQARHTQRSLRCRIAHRWMGRVDRAGQYPQAPNPSASSPANQGMKAEVWFDSKSDGIPEASFDTQLMKRRPGGCRESPSSNIHRRQKSRKVRAKLPRKRRLCWLHVAARIRPC